MTLLQQQDHQRNEEMRQSPSAQSTRERRPGSLKLEITKYHGVEDDSLLRWFVEVDDAIEARRIDDERMQVAFAKSYLAGDARNWALNLKLNDSNVFGSLRNFKTLLSETFEPPRQSSGYYLNSSESNRVSARFTLTLSMYDTLQEAW